MEYVIECLNLTHYYGKKKVYENLDFKIKKGSIFGLLGKNGTGKTTTINILNGYLTPSSGKCLIFGEDSQSLSPQTKSKIGYLMEGHIQYSFMDIRQIEKFYSAFYPKWRREVFFDLMSKLSVTPKQKISRMSCGQRSQVALGLVLAQDPDLMIMDDYSMGLDPGYRRLFLDYLKVYAQSENKTIFVTSHIIQDLDGFIDDMVIMGYDGILFSSSIENFKKSFKQYQFVLSNPQINLKKGELIKNYEMIKNNLIIYSFATRIEVESYIREKGISFQNVTEVDMSLEDAFIGITGKY